MKTKFFIISIAIIVALSSCSESDSNEMKRIDDQVDFTFWTEAQTNQCVNGAAVIYIVGKTVSENKQISKANINCTETGLVTVSVPKNSTVKVVFDSSKDITYITYVRMASGGIDKIYSTYEGISYRVQ